MSTQATVKERPILFNADMVRAILDGRKTQTRPVLKKQPVKNGAFWEFPWGAGCSLEYMPSVPGHATAAACPYGQPGDRLWVKESHADEHPLAIQEGRYSQEGRAGIPGPPPVDYRTIYRADGEPLKIWRSHEGHPYFSKEGPACDIDARHPTSRSNYTRKDGSGIHWVQANHMPRWASRILLEVASVRVERLNNISESDAMDEGIERPQHGTYRDYGVLPEDNEGYDYCRSAVESYKTLWESINGEGSWYANPWVWVVEFKCISKVGAAA